MILEGSGDLLAANAEAIVNTVNCVGVMGKGLALQFKRRYPDNYKAYVTGCKSGDVRLGKMFVHETNTITGPRYIINFPTKDHWRSKSRIEDIKSGLEDLVRVVSKLNIKSIAIPPLGTGNGGLDWRDVEPLMRSYLEKLEETAIYLYTPSNAARHLTPNPVSMTWGRATLVELLRTYVVHRLAAEPWEDSRGASHLEVQKLMYFAQYAAPTLRLRFEQGIYGPYSEQVRHLIQQMEGTFLTGFEDGTAPVQRLDPITPTPEGVREADRFMAESGKGDQIHKEIVTPVMEAIEGFEGPYGIELLASTHWAATELDCKTVDEAWSAIQKWTPRKARLFTEDHVLAAWGQLRESGLISSNL